MKKDSAYEKNDSPTNQSYHQKSHFQGKWVIGFGIIIFLFIVCLAIPLIWFALSHESEKVVSTDSSENMAFDVAINQGYDRYDTMTLAMNREQDVYNYLDEIGLKDIENYEYWSDSYNTLYASAEVGGYEDDVYYEIDISYANGVIDEENIYIERTATQSILNEKDLNLNRDILISLGNYLDIQNIYTMIDEKRVNMKRKEDEMIYQDESIYLAEYKEHDQYDLMITIYKK